MNKNIFFFFFGGGGGGGGGQMEWKKNNCINLNNNCLLCKLVDTVNWVLNLDYLSFRAFIFYHKLILRLLNML